MLHYSHRPLRLGGNTNSSLLTLVPKQSNPSSFSKFKPISLCKSSYKIFTKIITSCLKNVLPKIMSPNQGGFMHDRQIIDNIVLVQEAIHSSFAAKKKGMAIKLDMANAFDHVRHSFLFQVLQKFGFSMNFIKCIESCIIGPCISPLVNGWSTKIF
jgi:hypothetical protein